MSTPTHRRRTPVLFVIALITLAGPSLLAAVGPECRHVEGKIFVGHVDRSGLLLQVSGAAVGGLDGTYSSNLTLIEPIYSNYPVSFAGMAYYNPKGGGEVMSGQVGAIDLSTGNVAALANSFGRPGSQWWGFSGQIVLTGTLDFESGTGELRYSGDLCAKK